jgi:hypothetical protein
MARVSALETLQHDPDVSVAPAAETLELGRGAQHASECVGVVHKAAAEPSMFFLGDEHKHHTVS